MKRRQLLVSTAALVACLVGAGCAGESRKDRSSDCEPARSSGAAASPAPAVSEAVWRRLPIASADVRRHGPTWRLTVTTRTPPGWTVRVKEVPSNEIGTRRFEIVGLGSGSSSVAGLDRNEVSLVEEVDLGAGTELVVLTGSDGDLVMEVRAPSSPQAP